MDLREFKTMKIIYNDSINDDFTILYIHSKGVTYNGSNENVNDWVDYLIYFNITLNTTCLELLKNNDGWYKSTHYTPSIILGIFGEPLHIIYEN